MDLAAILSKEIAGRIGNDSYDLWFDGEALIDIQGNVAAISSTKAFTLDHVKRNFLREITAAAKVVLGENAEVNFRLSEAVENETVEDPADSAVGNASSSRNSVQRQSNNGVTQENASKDKQSRRAEWKTFVPSSGSRVAMAAMEMALEDLGSVSPLFVYGPTGCGKTHLLQGFAGQIRRRCQTRRVVYLSAEQFTSQFLEALHGSGLPSFRRKYREIEALLIDDLHFFANKRATIVELQHTIDTLLRQGRQVAFTADRSPAELSFLGPEMATRLAGGLVSRLDPPDAAGRSQIVARLAAERGLQLPSSVIEMIAQQLVGDVRQLGGAIWRLQAVSKAMQEPITYDLASRELDDIFQSCRRAVGIQDVEKVVCEVFSLDPKLLQSGKRSQAISHPRMLAMWLARKYTRAAYAEIGEYFGNRSHSTVISAEHKVADWVRDEATIPLAGGRCKVGDALRRLESALRTG